MKNGFENDRQDDNLGESGFLAEDANEDKNQYTDQTEIKLIVYTADFLNSDFPI